MAGSTGACKNWPRKDSKRLEPILKKYTSENQMGPITRSKTKKTADRKKWG